MKLTDGANCMYIYIYSVKFDELVWIDASQLDNVTQYSTPRKIQKTHNN